MCGFAEGFLGGRAPRNTREWRRTNWAEEEVKPRCTCNTGPGPSIPRTGLEPSGLSEFAQRGLGGRALRPDRDQPLVQAALRGADRFGLLKGQVGGRKDGSLTGPGRQFAGREFKRQLSHSSDLS